MLHRFTMPESTARTPSRASAWRDVKVVEEAAEEEAAEEEEEEEAAEAADFE